MLREKSFKCAIDSRESVYYQTITRVLCGGGGGGGGGGAP